ncbi:MAG TPA: hypothetical protein VK638_40225 [Edaphobacter sp.]|nr:hypothetical protein [Edaphobacter sp.]
MKPDVLCDGGDFGQSSVPESQRNEVFERVLKHDVKYRLVADMASLKI